MSQERRGYEERNAGHANPPKFRPSAKINNNAGRSNTPVFRKPPERKEDK